MFSVEACHKHAEAERSGTSLLCVLLGDLRDVSGHEVDRWVVFVVQSVGLSLQTSVVYQNTAVRVQTGEGSGDVLVDLMDFLDAGRVLELLVALFLDCDDDSISALNCCSALSLFIKSSTTMLTASMEYSTCKSLPSGEKMVIALS